MNPAVRPVMTSVVKSFSVLTLTALLVAAGAYAQPLTALPVEPLLETPITPTDITSNSATLLVTTTEDLACVVVYGADASFGRLALDLDMGGGAHRDHRVVMRGLEPDTEYRYRLQGSGLDGSFYASEVLSFRTLPAAAQPDPGENLARLDRGATVVEVSSEYSAAFAAVNAIDGDPDSEWSSRGDGDGAYLTVALPESVEVAGFGVWTRTMGASAQIVRFEVVNEHGEVFGPFELPDASGVHRFESEGEGRVFTFRVLDSSGGNTGLVELAIYGADAE